MTMIKIGIGRSIAVLILAMSGVLAFAQTEAEGTPVPFPESPSLPGVEALQSSLAHLQGFLTQADSYIQAVHNGTERYRAYMAHIQNMLASCEVNKDVASL